MLLEVTFIQAPQFEVGAASQATEFFLLPRLSADRIGRLGGAACAAENPFVGTGADIAAPPGRRRSADAGAPTIPDRPRAWRPDRSRAEFYANRPAAGANPSHPECAVGRLAHLRAGHLGRLARSDSPSAVRSCRSRQIVRRLRGRIAPPLPAAIHAVDDPSATPRYARSPAESLFASHQHPQFAVCASSFSQREERRNDITMLHYFCRRV